MTNRELLSAAAVQLVEPQRAASQTKPFQTIKSLPPRGDGDNAAQLRPGASYKLGPRPAKPVPADAIWLTSNQVCARYGGKSQMWLWRKIKRNPDFPKPVYFGRMMMFLVAELDAYDHGLISKRVGAER
jgi:predicted DNA-binding transcriptional regulator AlpA